MNTFYAGREAECAQRLARLAKALESPKEWLPAHAEVERLSGEGVEVSLAAVVPTLEVDEAHAAALREFVELCGEARRPATKHQTAARILRRYRDKSSRL